MRRKTFLKHTSHKLFRLSQGRALRLKRSKLQRTKIRSGHAIQFILQNVWGQSYLSDLSKDN